MKLHRLEARNFMPYKGTMELTFPRDEQQNVMIVFGDNMRGKTSILNAVRWVFYGEAMGRHSRPIPIQELVNTDAALEDDWRVEVHVKFEANDHVYDLRRIADRRPLVTSPSKPEDFNQEIFLTRDGSALALDKVEAEIGLIAPRQISRFFLFDGELLQEYETLLIENSQQGHQIKKAIEQVLGVPALTNGREDIQTILKQAQRRQNADLKQIKGLESQAERHEQLTTKSEAIEKDLEKLKANLESVHDQRTQLDDELEAAELVLSATATLEAKKQERNELIEECKAKESERLSLISGAWRDLIDTKLQIRRDQLERQRDDLMNTIERRSELNLKIATLRGLLATNKCPTCEQVLDGERRPQIGKALGNAEALLQTISEGNEALQGILGQLDALSKISPTNARDRLQQTEKDLQRYQVRLTQIENDIETLKDEIAGHDTAELARKRVLRDEKVKEEGRLQGEIHDQDLKYKRLMEELAVSQEAIKGLTKTRTQRSTIKASLCSDLERVFSQSIEKLRDKLRGRVEALATVAFKEMTTQKSYRGLEINDSYGLQIVDKSGRHVTVRSAGAEQVVALSLIDGLNRTGRVAGPVLMDTPFGRLDLNHRDNILRYLPTVTSQFVLLVHSGEIRKESDLAVIKEKIGSVYEIKEISSTQSRVERTSL